jgi:hypothetical protein
MHVVQGPDDMRMIQLLNNEIAVSVSDKVKLLCSLLVAFQSSTDTSDFSTNKQSA